MCLEVQYELRLIWGGTLCSRNISEVFSETIYKFQCYVIATTGVHQRSSFMKSGDYALTDLLVVLVDVISLMTHCTASKPWQSLSVWCDPWSGMKWTPKSDTHTRPQPRALKSTCWLLATEYLIKISNLCAYNMKNT